MRKGIVFKKLSFRKSAGTHWTQKATSHTDWLKRRRVEDKNLTDQPLPPEVRAHRCCLDYLSQGRNARIHPGPC